MVPDLDDYVISAVDCISKDTTGFRTSGHDITRLNSILSIIVDDIGIDNEEYSISDDKVKDDLKNLLNFLKFSKEPVDDFKRGLGMLKSEWNMKQLETYTVVFPLHLTFQQKYGPPDEYKIARTLIERISYNDWKNSYQNPAESTDEFKEFIEKSPNKIKGTHQTFWKFTHEAHDIEYTMEVLDESLSILLGEINYSVYKNKIEGWSSSRSIWQSGWSDLTKPFIYLVFQNGSYDHLRYETDIKPRKRLRISGWKGRRYKQVFDELPKFNENMAQIAPELKKAFRAFQAGITDPDDKDAFLNYWRGLENLTLSNDNEGTMGAVTKRSKSLFRSEHQPLFDARVDRIAKKRNSIVHDIEEEDITKENKNLAKTLLEGLIDLYCIHYNDWDINDFKYYLDNAGRDVSEIQKNRTRIHRELYLLHKITNQHKSIDANNPNNR